MFKKNQVRTDFESMSQADLILSKDMDDLIKMDVKRSFTTDPSYPRDKLYQILKCSTLALKNGVGYCHGMNYLAGYLLSLIGDEKETYKFFIALVEHKMKDIFNEDFVKLQSYFYVLENLIKINLPKLSKHFKVI